MALTTIKAVGFDLDQTLYGNTPEIQARVRGEIYNFISSTLDIPWERARERFEEAYKRIGEGGRTLESLGIQQGSERLRDCLARANVAQVLSRDEKLIQLMGRLNTNYFTFLITESREDDARRKLAALGLSADQFDFTAFWDSTELRKHTGTIFPKIFRRSHYAPEEHLYCGDKMNDDIFPAKKAGLKTVLVGSENSQADYCLPKIHDLEGLLYGR